MRSRADYFKAYSKTPKRSAWARARYAQAKADGVCVQCRKKPAVKGKTRCAEDLEYERLRWHDRQLLKLSPDTPRLNQDVAKRKGALATDSENASAD